MCHVQVHSSGSNRSHVSQNTPIAPPTDTPPRIYINRLVTIDLPYGAKAGEFRGCEPLLCVHGGVGAEEPECYAQNRTIQR